MNTRGLIMVIKDKQTKVAQYGQYDHYPDGQGSVILDFLKNWNRQKFENGLSHCQFIDDDTHTEKLHPSLSPETGANILQIIQDADKSVPLVDESNFANESLFCEWAYVIDLDNDMLEVYKGFNNEPNTPDNRFQSELDEGYYPVQLVVKFALHDLPTETRFVKLCEGEEYSTDDVFETIENIRNLNNGENELMDLLCDYLETNVMECTVEIVKSLRD